MFYCKKYHVNTLSINLALSQIGMLLFYVNKIHLTLFLPQSAKKSSTFHFLFPKRLNPLLAFR